jgi:hypothetical protein
MTDVVRRIIETHGGEEYWRSLEGLEAEVSVRGLLFTLKRVPLMKHVRVRLQTALPESETFDHPTEGLVTVFRGDDRVELRNASGVVVQMREKPRAFFRKLRRLLYWDALDFAYFSGYAMWNYLTTPFLFLQPGVLVEAGEKHASRYPFSLRVRFPEQLPTHCETQTFFFDENLHLRRHDYTAEVVGGWASVAHYCDEYRDFAGLRLPTKRRVYPIFFGIEFRFITIVAIDVHAVTVRKRTGQGEEALVKE